MLLDPKSALTSAFSNVQPSDRAERALLTAIQEEPQAPRTRSGRLWIARGAGLAVLAAALLLAFVLPPLLREDAPAGRPPGGRRPSEAVPGAERGYLGFSAVPAVLLTSKQREHWSVKAEKGVVAVRVLKGSPAEKAGLRNGDVMLKYAGEDLPSTQDLELLGPEGARAFASAFAKISSRVRSGDAVVVVVMRDGGQAVLQAAAVDIEAMKRIASASGEEDEGDEGDEEDGK